MGEVRRMIRQAAQSVISSFGYELQKRSPKSKSETSKCRARLAPYCTGYGIDLGPGGDPITTAAIRVDLPQPYTSVGTMPVQLGGDATSLSWFADASLDYVYSSHLLEDFEDIKPILIEWIRVLKPGGNLVIYCPDQQAYSAYCKSVGEAENPYHKDPNFSIETVKAALEEIGRTRVVHECPLVDVYSWELVARRIKSYAHR